MKTTEALICSLCQLPASIRDDDLSFCCHGCQAVYRILEARGQLSDFQDQPVFQQAVKSGLISNPKLLEALRGRSREKEDQQRLHLEIEDLWCPSCAEVIRLILLHEKGINECIVDYTTDLASIEFSPKHISKESILRKIEELGYRPILLTDERASKGHSFLLLRLIVAAFCSLNIMMFSWPFYATYFESDSTHLSYWLPWLSFLSSWPVLTFCAWPIFRRFWQGLKLGFLGMEALITMSVGSAFFLSTWNLFQGNPHIYFDSMTVVITLLLLGKLLESKAKFSAKESLMQLTRSLPRRGRKRHEDGTTSYERLKDFQVGDVLITHAGEKIVLDGVVIDGHGTADESLLTGEVIPIEKKLRDQVTAGAILQNGSIAYRVTATLEGSTLQQMVMMIEQELGHKARYTRITDTIVQWFVPSVILIALMTFFLSKDVARSLSILLIACPCTLGIAAPLVESRLIHRLARIGALVRNRGCLALLGKETLYVFDKTGTVTEGKFIVLSGLDNLSPKDRSILKAMCQLSSHPISQAIDQSLDVESAQVGSFSSFHGKGLQAVVDEEIYRLGSASWLDIPVTDVQGVTTVVHFAKNQICLATIELGDRIRQEVSKLIRDLPSSYLVSGDNEKTVSFVSRSCLFDGYLAEVHPLEKGEFVHQYRKKGEVVCFVGDGLNDAPAIAGANIGISVASATDMSIQSSDILLTTEDLGVIEDIRKLGVIASRRIVQNLFWAFGYNCVGIGLAVFGVLTPIYAAAAMVLSSLFVIVNAQRL